MFDTEIDFKRIEAKWQKKWDESKIFETDREDGKKKYFGNFPFPYVNGAMHFGHGYSAMKLEAMIRFQRMLGKNALWPFAFHATGEPIAGMAKRVKERNENQIRALMLSGVPEAKIGEFEDPYNIIRYFMSKAEKTFKSMGLAVDWRRKFVTTELYPVFSKFIEWQYRNLMDKGYVVKGSHPVIYCPSCMSPTGDHDRLEGEGVRIVEFVLYKFYSKEYDAYFLPGTLRPETVFGVTNVFLHPDAMYIKAVVDGENVIIAEDDLIKLKDQLHEVTEVETYEATELFGKMVTNPMTGKEIPLLPGYFIDIQGVTGVVMSVPAHAPVDWVTLQQIKSDSSISEIFAVSKDVLNAIEPISLLKVEGFGEFPAGDIIKQMGISDQNDERLKDATKVIYKKEYNGGVLKDITGKYAGKVVSEIKDKLIADVVEEGKAIILKEPAGLVVCRCGTRNHVKYLPEQWFLKFSDQEWKAKVHKLVDSMDIYPETARSSFKYTIDWLEDKACARKSGLGTPAPWDNEWIIETLSDSVIYMVFYMISKFVNSGEFKEEWAVDEVFDYVILGKGNRDKVAKNVGIPSDLLDTIREDVDYFYGFDIRSSGKDLINNHLTYMLFHHVAIFPEKYWPKSVHVNGYVKIQKKTASNEIVEEKMSKSKGNFKTIDDMIESVGADITRLAFLIAGEGMNDATVAIEELESLRKWIQNFIEMLFTKSDDDNVTHIDEWLYSVMQDKIKKAHGHMSRLETRSAFQVAFHETIQLLKWYQNRRGSLGPAYSYSVEKILLMISPFVPHIAEELWEKMGREGFIANQPYPEVEENRISITAENRERYLGEVTDSIKNLVSFLVEKKGAEMPQRVEIFISPEWKYDVYNIARSNGLKTLMPTVMKDDAMKKRGKAVSKYVGQLLKLGGPPDMDWSFEEEVETLKDSVSYLERAFGTKFEIFMPGDSDNPKAVQAIPRRPGINFVN